MEVDRYLEPITGDLEPGFRIAGQMMAEKDLG